MDHISDKLINKFLAGKRLTEDEFNLLDSFLNNRFHNQEIFHWLEKNWQQSQPEVVGVQFKQIKEKIRISSFKTRINQLYANLSKVAAVLFLPLLTIALYFYFNQGISPEMFTLSTQKGEHTNVILPDGSKAWLNVDSRLSYPVNFGVNNRSLELEGEAYFEVERNEKLPFEVTSGKITTKALGTKFIISAYPESSEIKSSLVSGSIQVMYGKDHKILKQGKQLVFNKEFAKTEVKPFDENYELAWKNDELVFRLTPFDNVILKLEKWYDVNIDYNPDSFKSETLTVRFEKYESLEQVFRIISKTNDFQYSIIGNNIKIMKK